MSATQRAIFPDTAEEALKEEFFGTKPGYFVDVGANDPKAISQSWDLEQKGWTGVLVEPQPALAQKLREQRAAKVFACACSSPANTGKMLQLHVAGIHSSLNPDFFVAGMRREDVIEVPARTLDDILEEAKAPTPIDLLSIDVENHEIEVLSGVTLTRWGPRLILIEDLALNLRIHHALTSRGYKWVRRTGLNSWYVPDDVPFPLSPFGHWQFVRKHYLGVPFRHFRETKRKLRERLRATLTRTRSVQR
jgi:FkbM family methyltransferase